MVKLSLCKEACCPTVTVVGGQVVIEDDQGVRVTLTKEQLRVLVARFPEIEAHCDGS
ncbi:MAG: hypothetical protein PHC60_07060 [Heliobacteriaceae bacterium]|nr:hypothetical protein [Heliobacteriaceae bacterium]MDD4588129.1 hypothetical protein [Heliobacteriaceae bacterium]